MLVWKGNIAIKDCCAKPQHELREATMEDVQQWLREREIKYYMAGPTVTLTNLEQSACMCQSEHNNT